VSFKDNFYWQRKNLKCQRNHKQAYLSAASYQQNLDSYAYINENTHIVDITVFILSFLLCYLMKCLTRIIGYPAHVLYYYKDIIYVTIVGII